MYGAYLRIEPKPWKFYEGGVSYRTSPSDRVEAKDDPNKLNFDINLLFGWRFFPDDEAQRYGVSVAAGLIETKIGGYVEFPVVGDFNVRVMGRFKDNQRNVDDRRYEDGDFLLRATLGYRIWKRIYLNVGVNDLIDHPGLWGGIRVDLLDNDLRNLTSVSAISP